MSKSLQHKMQAQMDSKALFQTAQSYAFDYLDQSAERVVFPTEKALDNLAVFDEPLPNEVGDGEAILRQLHEYGSPASINQIGGRYFGFVNGSAVPTALATRGLTDYWDQNTALYLMSPIVSKLEEVTESWLAQLLGLPTHTAAGFVSGTSMAILCGLAAGRYRVLQRAGWDVNGAGLNGAPAIRVVTCHQTHAAVVKIIGLLGFGIDNVEWVEADQQGRIVVEKIPPLDDRTILILQAGNVNSGAFDDFASIVEKARDAGAWIHIDGAFGLWAAAVPKLQHLTHGMQHAHSWSGDGHKTLNTPYDSGVVLCADREALINALQANGAYLTMSEQRDGMLYTPEMSRRARVVELWATLKFLGRAGADEMIYGLHERACELAQQLHNQGFRILNDVVFNQIIVACDTQALTIATLHVIQQQRECWVGGSVWFDESVIRVSVCSWATTSADIHRTAQSFVSSRNIASDSIG